MSDKIHVRPASERRRDFARWATGYTVRLRTVGPDTFAVPPHLFVDVPEELLVGAIVDGRRYRSPLEDEETGTPPPGRVEEREAVPGEPLPPVPDWAYPPDAVPLPDGPAEDSVQLTQEPQEVPEEAYGPGSVPVDVAPSQDAPGPGAGKLAVVGEDGPETYVPARDTQGDTPADSPAPGEDTAVGSGNSTGDTSLPYRCGACPRSFKTERGRDSHRRQAHGR